MKATERTDGGQIRAILISMVTDPGVLGAVAARWDGKLFGDCRWANVVGGWCVKYHQKYRKAPGKHIGDLYEQWGNSSDRDKDTVKLVESFLSALSDEYDKDPAGRNTDYVLDLCGRYFNSVRLKELGQELQALVEAGDVEKAEQLRKDFNRVEVGQGAGVSLLRDEAAVLEVGDQSSEVLIQYPDALGEFFGDTLSRDSFVAILAPEKRGKSFWQLDVGWTAMTQKRRVAYFEVGDMSQRQVIRRLLVRASKTPRKPGKVKYPTKIFHEEDKPYSEVELADLEFDKGMDPAKAWKKLQKLAAKLGDDDLFRLSVHPNSTLKVDGIKAILDGWDRRGWFPDVIVVDYADILAPPSGVAETRDQINATWKQLRALNQETHCCLVTATQANAASYSNDQLGMANFSEDKRKFAHVTGMFALNQTSGEKREGLYRLNWVVLRENEFTSDTMVHVAGCLALARPAVLSTF